MRKWSRCKGVKTGVYSKCLNCGKEVYCLPSRATKGRGRYCSHSCRAIANYPKQLKEFSGGIIAQTAGKIALLAFAKIVREDETKHGKWKGDDVKYGALHGWLVRRFGKPCKCEVCGIDDPLRHYQWANLSHEYRVVGYFENET